MDYTKKKKKYPVIPLRGMVMFPHMVVHFDIGKDISLKALEEAELRDGLIFLVAQKEPREEDVVSKDELHKIGTIVQIKQMLKIPGGHLRVLVEGVNRGRLTKLVSNDPFLEADVEEIEYKEIETDKKLEAGMRLIREDVAVQVNFLEGSTSEIIATLTDIKDPGQLADIIASTALSKLEDAQEVLDELNISKRLDLVHIKLRQEIEIIKIESKISNRLKDKIMKVQKEHYLREQIKAIQEELGDEDEFERDIIEYEEKLSQRNFPEEVEEKFRKELSRLEYQNENSSEAGVIRTYLDWILDLPWDIETEDEFDIKEARDILNEDHYGLKDVKERILEHMALKKVTKKSSGAIICLIGPPGVGKTSVAKSMARAMHKNFVRVSLGGISDEAEIRGHRRTYIGAMPGNIINGLKKAKSKNPLFLLDEIDKLGRDYKGDPTAAMLEVLDPEQNNSFTDHYLDLPFDLSDVMFITTANTTQTIPEPLLDRMEVIEISGYTAEEKFNIAKGYLVPKNLEKLELAPSKINISDAVIKDLIDYYTRESGVRKLEGKIKSLIRKSVKNMLEEDKKSYRVSTRNLEELLGVPRYRIDKKSRKDEVGKVTGLAWTSVGGETLIIEVNVMDGTGKTITTGQLGDVMKESAMAAISYVRSKRVKLKLSKTFYKDKDIHIHVPEGAIPKDGPSAGITIATGVASALTAKKVRSDVAMTGEITIRGDVLPIGGLKEKLLAAKRMGIFEIIVPMENRKDFEDLEDNIKEGINIHYVKHMDEVLKIALAE